MREIKFRAWNKTTKVMNNKFHLSHLWNLPFEENNSNWVLMQYTGLKDKNEKDIFEGDILRIDFGNPIDRKIPNYSFSEVLFFEGNYILPDRKILGRPTYLSNVKNYCEIIGNIYENKELLK